MLAPTIKQNPPESHSPSPTNSPSKSPRPFRYGEPSSPSKLGRTSGMSARASMMTNEDQMSQG